MLLRFFIIASVMLLSCGQAHPAWWTCRTILLGYAPTEESKLVAFTANWKLRVVALRQPNTKRFTAEFEIDDVNARGLTFIGHFPMTLLPPRVEVGTEILFNPQILRKFLVCPFGRIRKNVWVSTEPMIESPLGQMSLLPAYFENPVGWQERYLFVRYADNSGAAYLGRRPEDVGKKAAELEQSLADITYIIDHWEPTDPLVGREIPFKEDPK